MEPFSNNHDKDKTPGGAEGMIPYVKDLFSPKQCLKCATKLSDGDVLCQCRECPHLTLCQHCEQSELLQHLFSKPSHVFLKMILASPDRSDVVSLPFIDGVNQNGDDGTSLSNLGSEWSDCDVNTSLAQVGDKTDHSGINFTEDDWFEAADWVKSWTATGLVNMTNKPSQSEHQLPNFRPKHDETDSESFSIIDPADVMNVLSLSDTSDDEEYESHAYSTLKQFPVSTKPINICKIGTDSATSGEITEDQTPQASLSPDVGLNSLLTSDPRPSEMTLVTPPSESDSIEDLAELTIQVVQNAGAVFMDRFRELLNGLEEAYVPHDTAYKPPESNYVPPMKAYIPQSAYVPKPNTYIPRQTTYIPVPHSDSVVHRHLKDLDTPWVPKHKYVPKTCD